MSGTTLLTTLGVLITVLLAGAGGIGAWAALRVGRNTTVLANYKAAAESAQSVAASLEQEVRQLRAELTEAKDTAARERSEWTRSTAELTARIGILQELATGHSTLEALGKSLENSLVAKVGDLRTEMVTEFERTRAVIGTAK